MISADCSRPSGFKSSLNRVHLKIHHAFEATSSLTDQGKMPFWGEKASGYLAHSHSAERGCVREHHPQQCAYAHTVTRFTGRAGRRRVAAVGPSDTTALQPGAACVRRAGVCGSTTRSSVCRATALKVFRGCVSSRVAAVGPSDTTALRSETKPPARGLAGMAYSFRNLS